ncbi:MAG: ImmA/IrrE family metallo-endopeptidase [Pseudomonadota bacterium]
MATPYANAVRKGAMAAGRLHRRFGLRERLEASGGSVNVFSLISQLDLPLMLRPLDGLLGAYFNVPTKGILVTTQRRLSIQRFTAAHELGHCELDHQISLDNEDSMLRRMPASFRPAIDQQEVEADGFATALLMPKWLLAIHMKRQGWTQTDLRRPSVVYQFSLRLGVSYEALCWTMVRLRMLQQKDARALLQVPRRDLKQALLAEYRPQDYRGDVWLLTERDAGGLVDGSRNDLFVLKLTEHSNGGYLWNIDELRASGFVIVQNSVEAADQRSVGDPGLRRVTACPPDEFRGRMVLEETRPWDVSQRLTRLELEMDMSGPEEEGLSRAERRRRLEAA